MSAKAIIDFDDLCDGNDPLSHLMVLKDRDGGFKVTLFAIPTRCSDTLLAAYDKHRDWIELAVHGWRHSRHECLAWTSEETVDKLNRALSIYQFAKVFKAPNWELCDENYIGLKQSGFIVADHIRNIEILPGKQSHYIYNMRLRNDKFNRLHGHIQPWAGTGLTENVTNGTGVNANYVLPVGTSYGFVSEAITNDKGYPG